MRATIGFLCRQVLVSILVATLPSCVVHEPKDLKLEDLSIVTLGDEQQLLHTGIAYVDGDPRQAKFLKIAFSSATDLVRFSKEHGYHIGYDTRGCQKGADVGPEFVSSGDLRVGNRWLDWGSYIDGYLDGSRDSLAGLRRADGRIVYIAGVPLDGKETRSRFRRAGDGNAVNKELFDYAHHSSDVCITLRGGTMAGGRFISAPLVIPKERILQTISSFGPR